MNRNISPAFVKKCLEEPEVNDILNSILTKNDTFNKLKYILVVFGLNSGVFALSHITFVSKINSELYDLGNWYSLRRFVGEIDIMSSINKFTCRCSVKQPYSEYVKYLLSRNNIHEEQCVGTYKMLIKRLQEVLLCLYYNIDTILYCYDKTKIMTLNSETLMDDLSEFYKLVEDSDNIFMENVLSFLVGYNV